MVQGEVIPIFYQRKAPSICCVVVEEEVESEAGTELVLCGKLEAEKLPSRFCIACTLTIPKEGKPPIRMANFSEKTMLLRPGQTLAQFYPLDHIDASINLWKLEETCTENKAKQDAGVETPSPEPPVWK